MIARIRKIWIAVGLLRRFGKQASGKGRHGKGRHGKGRHGKGTGGIVRP